MRNGEKEEIKLAPYQTKFIYSKARYPALVGGWATGKTLCLITRAYNHCMQYPNSRGMLVRKEFTDLRDSTMEDFKQYTGISVGANNIARFKNGSSILFRHAEEVNNLQNINLAFFGIEQAEELPTPRQFNRLTGRIRQKNVGPNWGAVIANQSLDDGYNWVYHYWKLKTLSGLKKITHRGKTYSTDQKMAELIEASSYDAPFISDDNIVDWKAMEKRDPEAYRKLILNEWIGGNSDSLILYKWIEESCNNSDREISEPVRSIISLDVAAGGKDSSVAYVIKNGIVVEKQKYNTRDTMRLVGIILLLGAKHYINNYAIDEIGVGNGVSYRLQEIGKNVIPIDSRKTQSELASNMSDKIYFNRRAEIYCYAQSQFQLGTIRLLPDDKELIEQLQWVRYDSISSSKVKIIPKERLKKEHNGQSPDSADSFVNGIWALQFVEPVHDEYSMYLDDTKSYLSNKKYMENANTLSL